MGVTLGRKEGKGGNDGFGKEVTCLCRTFCRDESGTLLILQRGESINTLSQLVSFLSDMHHGPSHVKY